MRLPSGDRLTPRRFRQLGLWLGDSAGFELLHHVVELPFGSLAFLHDTEAGVRFGRNPIYATLHESSYADGVATRWSGAAAAARRGRRRGLFTAEHVFPWMWEDYARAARRIATAAELLAEHAWPRALRRRPARAATRSRSRRRSTSTTCTSERDFAEETAATIRGIRTWETDEFEHNGLRADGERVLGRLIDLVRGRA